MVGGRAEWRRRPVGGKVVAKTMLEIEKACMEGRGEEAERLLAPGVSPDDQGPDLQPGDARTRRILLLRGDGWTLSRIGKLFGITRERVRQIVARARRLPAAPSGSAAQAGGRRR